MIERKPGELWIDGVLVLLFDEPLTFTMPHVQILVDVQANFPWILPIDARGRWNSASSDA